MKKRIVLSMLPIMAIACETLPYGAILRFASDAECIDIETFSYFDPVPFGFGNFGPLLTAILTVIILILTAINLFKTNKVIENVITVISILAVITSLMPLMFGFVYLSLVGAIISIILIAEAVLSIFMKK